MCLEYALLLQEMVNARQVDTYPCNGPVVIVAARVCGVPEMVIKCFRDTVYLLDISVHLDEECPVFVCCYAVIRKSNVVVL